MEYTREELLPGVFLTAVQTDKFKQSLMSVTLLRQLCPEDAAMNAAVPYVLRRGTTRCPDMEKLAAALDSLYGASIVPAVRKLGEIQAVGFFGSVPEDAFLPRGEEALRGFTSLFGQMLLSPNTRGGLLLPAYVEDEQEKLLRRIGSRINDKGSYAMARLIENMCCCEDFAVYKYGDEDHAEQINYQKLTKHYRRILSESPIEIFYCGMAAAPRLREYLTDALSSLPRGDLNFDIGTEVRMNSLEESTRYFTEELDVTQGKLAMGWRLGESMEEPDFAALRVFNALFGGGVTSKLFMTVRERLSLCYYASSALDLHKGVLMVGSGIEFDKYNAARDEINAQLAAVAAGDFTDEELGYARKSVMSNLSSVPDDPFALENYYLGMNVDGSDCTPEELSAACEDVTREQVARIAALCEPDAVYFLQGKERAQ